MIKAFNNIYFKSLLENGRPKGTPDRIALPVCGDPVEARAKVLRLVDELGFDPVDAGGIEESWRQQPGTPCYTQNYNAVQLKAALAAAVPQLGARISQGGGRCGESVLPNAARLLMARLALIAPECPRRYPTRMARRAGVWQPTGPPQPARSSRALIRLQPDVTRCNEKSGMAVRTDAHWFASCEVCLDFVSELCSHAP